MISRRSVRIKTMQVIYAYERSENVPVYHFDNLLEKNILSTQGLYLYMLLIIREVANFVETESIVKAKKLLPTTEDKNFNTKLLSNLLIQYLNHDEEYREAIKKDNLVKYIDEVIIRKLFKQLVESEAYEAYLANTGEFDYEVDRKLISYLFEEIMLTDEVFISHLEEEWPVWDDDAELVVSAVRDVIRKSKHELKLQLQKHNLKEKFTELLDFSAKLFHKVLENKEEHEVLIAEKLRNWEADRLAILDNILLRMALAELLFFPSIPVKVTINEYIDIAKEYSTPKSKEFINGVLDKIMKELREKGVIVKTGRGLIEQ